MPQIHIQPLFVRLIQEQGDLKVPELEVIPLEQIGEKLLEMSQQRTLGKIVASVIE
ncbi:hypothetical protein QWY96_18390 [Vibrio artabrorum]|uniref:Alcohol dehydrogenase n=1 Tax=Vibrio artabrorum TaxID=446374 RepID=A0ABT8CKW7_9VIBR|nr:hypothetical protein [Vibrio artabrorum]MDN3702397.1 hypothetical protein [Vibrio artabrorum]